MNKICKNCVNNEYMPIEIFCRDCGEKLIDLKEDKCECGAGKTESYFGCCKVYPACTFVKVRAKVKNYIKNNAIRTSTKNNRRFSEEAFISMGMWNW